MEASVEGSMILAGVLLKLGVYGIYRIYIFIRIELNMFFLFLIRLSLLRRIFVSFICFRQIDLKMIIAYSSVSHIGLVIGGIIVGRKLGAYGVLGMALAHGFCSRGLFFIGGLFYEIYSTRNLLFIKGGIVVSQVLVFL